MADRTYSLVTQLSLNSQEFKAGISKIKRESQEMVKSLIDGVEGVTGSINEYKKSIAILNAQSTFGKSAEEVDKINKRIGILKDDMADLKATQMGMGMEFGNIFAKGLQGLAAAGEIIVGVASTFGVSKEQAEKYQRAMVQLIGVSQAFATIQGLIEERTIQIIAAKIKDTVVTVSQTVATKAATVAQIAFNSALAISMATIGLIVAAVAAVAVGIYLLIRAIKNHNEEAKLTKAIAEQNIKNKEREKKANDDFTNSYISNYAKQKVAIDKYVAVASDEQLALSKRQKALSDLIKLDPTYLNGLNLQNIKTQEGIKIINAYTEALDKKARVQAAEKILVDLYEEQYKLQLQNIKAQQEQTTLSNLRKGTATTPWGEDIKIVEPVSNKEIEKRGNVVRQTLATVESALNSVNSQINAFNDIIQQDVNVNFGSEELKNVQGPYEQLVAKVAKLKSDINDVAATGGIVTPEMLSNLADAQKQLQDLDTEIEKMQLQLRNVASGTSIVPIESIGVVSTQIKKPEIVDTSSAIAKRIAMEKNLTSFIGTQYNERANALKESLLKQQISEKQYNDAVQTLNRQQKNDTIANIADTFGQAASIFEEHTIAYKALAIAQAVMNTYLAATQAYSVGLQAGFPVGLVLGPAMAAVAIAAGLANVAKIAGAFETGGIVPGSSYTGDKVPVMANSGEMILNKGQQANLFSMLNNGVGGSGREVVFRIDGTQLVGVLNNHSRKINAIR